MAAHGLILVAPTAKRAAPMILAGTSVQNALRPVTTQPNSVVTVTVPAPHSVNTPPHALLTTVQPAQTRILTTPALALVTIIAHCTAYIHRHVLRTSVQDVLLDITSPNRALVTVIAY